MAKHPCEIMHERFVDSRDLAHLFIGGLISYGMNRHVYKVERDPTIVIKYEPGGDEFQNVMEWRVWQACSNFSKLSKWLAPCVALSPNGVWLIQKRITIIPPEKYPKKVPAWMGDCKYANFGMLDGEFVACDYGMPSFSRLMSRQAKLEPASWWAGNGPTPNG